MTVVDTAVRADARRNRAKLLDAASAAFAADGLSISLADVARRAGVGAGTVYRHFPTKELLVEAVLARGVDEMAAAGRRWRTQATPDAAFFGFVTEVIAKSSARRHLCQIVTADRSWPRAGLAAATHRFEQALGEALHVAQGQGVVRADIDGGDLAALVVGCVAAENSHPDPAAGARVTRLVLDGLRVTKPVTNQRIACAECGTPVDASPTGRPRRYCGDRCRQRAHRRRGGAG